VKPRTPLEGILKPNKRVYILGVGREGVAWSEQQDCGKFVELAARVQTN